MTSVSLDASCPAPWTGRLSNKTGQGPEQPTLVDSALRGGGSQTRGPLHTQLFYNSVFMSSLFK